jgi:SAM-dependent methyltransferase
MDIHQKDHWENIYTTKQPHEVSWTQDIPSISLELIRNAGISKDAKIIDVGGGDSKLVDFLLNEGYTNISVLDISQAAILRAKERLGNDAQKVNWIVTDILNFSPTVKYDLWHDRAAFHFQTKPENIEKYLEIVETSVNGILIVGTFSVDGPKKCSGLEIKQYDENLLQETFKSKGFACLECKRENHVPPMQGIQNFIFCRFLKQ